MNKNEHSELINQHYHRTDLERELLNAYEREGPNIDARTPDELHIRGREATRELATLAEVTNGTTVLDVGSGLGGAARTLATEFGCRVVGVDLTEPSVHIATSFTEHVGLADRVSFQVADATDLPFEDEQFDVVWMQHTSMNVDDKERLFSELHRVLRPGGRLALYEICAGSGGSPHFPVPWASDPSINSLVSPERMRELLVDCGFEISVWKDVSTDSAEWLRETTEPAPGSAASNPQAPAPGHNVFVTEAASDPIRNVLRNIEEERIRVIMAVIDRSS